jgi:hypothetical protein
LEAHVALAKQTLFCSFKDITERNTPSAFFLQNNRKMEYLLAKHHVEYIRDLKQALPIQYERLQSVKWL